MKALFIMSLLALLTVGCSIEVENTDLVPSTPVVSNPFPLSIKYSGGANEASGSTVDAELSIGPKERSVEGDGTTVDATFSISTNRPSL